MSFETLSHTPEFELPASAPSAPADVISILEESYEGLASVVVSKMIRRGKYEQIAKIICQDNPSSKTRPIATIDDIADYCMMCMQYDVEKTDDPGTYKLTFFGAPGKGRKERSKHVSLSGDDTMAQSKTMLSEGELLEQQANYIGELHSHLLALSEIVTGITKPLMNENKEMMKVITESARRLGEIERDRMRHDLEIRIHNDEIKAEEAREQAKSDRWNQTMEVIKESGAIDGLIEVIKRKVMDDKKKEPTEPRYNSVPKPEKMQFKDEDISHGKSKVEKAKESGRIKKSKSKESIKDSVKNGEELTAEQLSEVFSSSGMQKAQENPLALIVEILKMSFEENEKMPVIEKTLTSEQYSLFCEILESEDDKEIEKKLKNLYKMKGAARMLRLEKHLSKDERKHLDVLIEIATSD